LHNIALLSTYITINETKHT